ncbi:MAG TPA: metallophosphatase [Bacteroidia bacterium]|nr:metallophosphatase [Bacteroidia bacterium]HNT80266.1 metallophosphatase [Bacteroidia bacterium]
MNHRRDFIKRVCAGTALLSVGLAPLKSIARSEMEKITILHTNDVHSHIEPFPSNDPKFPGLGGAERRAALIHRIRNEEEHVLLLDAGDLVQGTPYFNVFKGEVEYKLMNEMQYDAATLGNHDFDNGLDGLQYMLNFAKFPMICSNYSFDQTTISGMTIPYKVFDKGDMRIGVFGLGIELNGLVEEKLFGKTKYENPEVKAAYYAHHLKTKEKCDLIICLSHLGFKYPDEKISDVGLAKKSLYIDCIIGGHTHTFLKEPVRVYNRAGKEVLIAQTGWAGINLGRIDFYLERKNGLKIGLGSSKKISK